MMGTKKYDEEEKDELELTDIISPINSFFYTVGDILVFSGKFAKNLLATPHEFREMLRQAYHFGNGSLTLVGITAFIIGMVITMQTHPTLQELGAESWMPAMVSISIVREIGPLVTALICAGKIGSNLGAEIGSMRVTEQIDAMLVSGAKPMNFIVKTRVLAVAFMLPVLVFYADALAFAGAYLSLNMEMNITLKLFITQAMEVLDFGDVIPATFKTFLFGLAIGLVGCYQGFNAKKGTTGVGKAANSSVVIASLLIFVIDLLVVQIQKLFF